MYYKSESGGTIAVGTYVDDLLAISTSEEMLDTFETDMRSLEFEGLGPVENFLGMRIGFSLEMGYSIVQEQKITELLKKHGLEKANSVRSPIAAETTLDSEARETELFPNKVPGNSEIPTVLRTGSEVGSKLRTKCI